MDSEICESTEREDVVGAGVRRVCDHMTKS